MDIKQYHHAIIGCGRIAPVHKDAFLCAQVSKFSYCDLDIKKAELLSDIGDSTYVDYKSIPIDGLNSVSVCTDHASHLSISEYFLSKGVSVIVEKPCCLPTQYPEKVLKCSSHRFPVYTQIAQHRYDSIVLFVKSLIDKGKLGDIVLADFTLYCHRSEEYYSKSPWKGKYEFEGGSAIANQAFHLVDLINFFFGFTQNIKTYKSNYWLKNTIETDETAYALFHYPEFCVSFKTTICSSEKWLTRLDIVGNKATISFSIDEPFTFYYYSDAIKGDIESYLQTHREECSTQSQFGYFGNSHKKQIKSFVESNLKRKYINLPALDSIWDTHKMLRILYL